MIKKVLYFFPFVIMTIFTLVIGLSGGTDLTGMLILAALHVIPTFVTGVVLSKGHPFGSFIGIFYAVSAIGFNTYEGNDSTAQMPLGLVFIVYYAICAWICSKSKTK